MHAGGDAVDDLPSVHDILALCEQARNGKLMPVLNDDLIYRLTDLVLDPSVDAAELALARGRLHWLRFLAKGDVRGLDDLSNALDDLIPVALDDPEMAPHALRNTTVLTSANPLLSILDSPSVAGERALLLYYFGSLSPTSPGVLSQALSEATRALTSPAADVKVMALALIVSINQTQFESQPTLTNLFAWQAAASSAVNEIPSPHPMHVAMLINRADASYHLAQALREEQLIVDAIEHLQPLVGNKPILSDANVEFEQLRNELANLLAWRSNIFGEQPDAAFARVNNSASRLLSEYQTSEQQQVGDRVIELFDRALFLAPTNARRLALSNLGAGLLQCSGHSNTSARLRRAEMVLREAIVPPTSPLTTDTYVLERFDEINVQSNEMTAMALANLSLVLSKIDGGDPEARKIIDQVLREMPRDAGSRIQFRIDRAIVYLKAGKALDDVAMFRQLFEAESEERPSNDSRLVLALARARQARASH